MGTVLEDYRCDDLVIVSDDAGQFNVLLHALCWVHTERLIHKMLPLNDTHREEIEQIRDQIWCFYADLKSYKEQSDESLRYFHSKHYGKSGAIKSRTFQILRSSLRCALHALLAYVPNQRSDCILHLNLLKAAMVYE